MASTDKIKPRAVILARVSTKSQETDRQVTELSAVAKSKNWRVVNTFRETISGSAGNGKGWDIVAERETLATILELAESGKIDKVMVHEVSRISRRNSDAHRFVERLADAGVSLYWHQHSIETLLDDGKRNPAASIMFALMAELARSEREILRERVKSGIAEAKRKGVKFGRPTGTQESDRAFLKKHKDIIRELERGATMREIRDYTGKSMGTIQKVRTLTKG